MSQTEEVEDGSHNLSGDGARNPVTAGDGLLALQESERAPALVPTAESHHHAKPEEGGKSSGECNAFNCLHAPSYCRRRFDHDPLSRLRSQWPTYGLTWSHGAEIDLDAAFANWSPPAAPDVDALENCGNVATVSSTLARAETRATTRVLEVGCGSGEAIIANAAARPAAQFVGVDWFRAGHAIAMQELEQKRITNVRLVRADAALFLERGLPARPLFDEVSAITPRPPLSEQPRSPTAIGGHPGRPSSLSSSDTPLHQLPL